MAMVTLATQRNEIVVPTTNANDTDTAIEAVAIAIASKSYNNNNCSRRRIFAGIAASGLSVWV